MKKEPKQTKPSNRIGYFPENAPIWQGPPAPQKQKPPKKNLLRPVLTAACAVVFVVCAVSLIRYFVDIGRARSASDELRRTYAASQTLPEETAVPAPAETAVETAVPEPVSTPEALPTQTRQPADTAADFASQWAAGYANNPQLRISESFQKLRQQNRDVVGWLSIAEVLDEPVLQRDNSFYLTHDASGQKNATGALFLDEGCNLRIPTPHLVIHGHNMKEGAMFGSLKNTSSRTRPFIRNTPFSPSIRFTRKPSTSSTPWRRSASIQATRTTCPSGPMKTLPPKANGMPTWVRFGNSAATERRWTCSPATAC